MTHESEDDFTEEVVGPCLRGVYGANNVEEQKKLVTPSGHVRYADYWVDTGLVFLAVEVENDAGSIREGVIQAEQYAMQHPKAVPVVIIPEDHTQYAAVEQWRTRLPVIEL